MLSTVIAYAPRAWKAITAGALAGSGSYATALKDGVTAPEWIIVAAAALAAGVGTWLVRNKPDAAAAIQDALEDQKLRDLIRIALGEVVRIGEHMVAIASGRAGRTHINVEVRGSVTGRDVADLFKREPPTL